MRTVSTQPSVHVEETGEPAIERSPDIEPLVQFFKGAARRSARVGLQSKSSPAASCRPHDLEEERLGICIPMFRHVTNDPKDIPGEAAVTGARAVRGETREHR